MNAGLHIPPLLRATARRSANSRDSSTVGGGTILLMLLFASMPLFLGGALPLGMLWLKAIGGCALVLWSATLVKNRRLPSVPILMWLPILSALTAGWLGALNPEFCFHSAYEGFEAIAQTCSWLPSSIDAKTSREAMVHWSLMSGLLFMTRDLCGSASRRRLLHGAFIFGGLLVLVIAIGQRLAQAGSVLGSGVGAGMPFFGTFLYPGSAGAFFNLLLPSFGIAYFSKGVERIFGAVGILGVCLALLWNTSRLSSVIGMAVLCFLSAIAVSRTFTRAGAPVFRAWKQSPDARYKWFAAVLLAALALSIFPIPPLFEKWRLLPHQWHLTNPRLEAVRAVMLMAGDAGIWGMGAGTFANAFPHYAHGMNASAQGFWRHAHCDYLEWLVEWGWAGTFLWALIPIGALARQAGALRANQAFARKLEAGCVVCAIGVLALHSVADFPLANPSIQLLGIFWLGCGWRKQTGACPCE